MRLYLVRHFESEKNRKATLSTAADSDGLTAEGSKRCVEFARVFREELSANGHHVPTILASSSARGMQTASAISKALGVRDVRSCTFLRSTLAGPYGGFSATKIRQTNRKWSDAFQLYKAGLFNQYLFDEPSLTVGAERKSDFEQRVVNGLLPFLIGEASDALVVVANRSSLTAILLHFARESYRYPRDFYGYVQIDLGSVSVLERTPKGKWEFLKVNSRSPKVGRLV